MFSLIRLAKETFVCVPTIWCPFYPPPLSWWGWWNWTGKRSILFSIQQMPLERSLRLLAQCWSTLNNQNSLMWRSGTAKGGRLVWMGSSQAFVSLSGLFPLPLFSSSLSLYLSHFLSSLCPCSFTCVSFMCPFENIEVFLREGSKNSVSFNPDILKREYCVKKGSASPLSIYYSNMTPVVLISMQSLHGCCYPQASALEQYLLGY